MQNRELKGLKKLNLGCGRFKKEGYVNLDVHGQLEPDVVHDLNSMPYPFADNSFELIEADHVLEHLSDPFRAMKELHRISRAGGRVLVRVPHFSRGFTHPEHKRGFDVSFPYYFNPSFQGGYCGVEFICDRVRLRWFAQPYLKKKTLPLFAYYFGVVFGNCADLFANLSPFLCSRLWCFLVGGFEEAEFCFICRK
ncbi:MAG: methyltransferase domain-containing protein [Candidatus Omnitrophica bacterium]|nr:methyltransferase domain-containing protein [Candidatus Omnitrophota bacterium]